MTKKTKTKSTVIPLHDKVIILPDPLEEKTAGGLFIPATGKEKLRKGLVKSCGNGFKDAPLTVKPEDRVVYNASSGVEFTVDDESYLIMREADILAIL